MATDGNTLKYVAVAQAAPGANTAIISGGFTVPTAGAIRFSFSPATATVFNLTATPAGVSKRTIGMNSSVAIAAGDGYTGVWSVSPKDQNGNVITYNFEIETDGIISYLQVDFEEGGMV